jgi:hypothetical protein
MGLRWIVMLAAGLALAIGPARADEPKRPVTSKVTEATKAPVVPHGFFERFLAPRVAAGLYGETDAAVTFSNHAANPWTRDNETVGRIGTDALRETKRAVKRYAIESLGVDRWSVPLLANAGSRMDSRMTSARGTRLRFGISHMSPRADVTIPVANGRFAVSVNTRGELDADFETVSRNFRMGISFDPAEHSATFSLARLF